MWHRFVRCDTKVIFVFWGDTTFRRFDRIKEIQRLCVDVGTPFYQTVKRGSPLSTQEWKVSFSLFWRKVTVPTGLEGRFDTVDTGVIYWFMITRCYTVKRHPDPYHGYYHRDGTTPYPIPPGTTTPCTTPTTPCTAPAPGRRACHWLFTRLLLIWRTSRWHGFTRVTGSARECHI